MPTATDVRRRRLTAHLRRRGRGLRHGRDVRRGRGRGAPGARPRRPRPRSRRATTPAAPGATPDRRRPTPVDALSLQQQVGRLVVLRFNGTTVPSYVRKVLHNGWASGAILFKENVSSPQQLPTLTAALRKSGPGGRRDADRLHRPGGRRDPQRRRGRRRPPRSRRRCRAATRRRPRWRCAAAGINVSARAGRRRPLGRRRGDGAGASSRATPRASSTATRAAIGGWLAGGVKPTVKHFPGLGGATVNTDHGLGDDPRRRAHERRPGPVQGGDRGQGADRDELARGLSATGCAPHRVAVAGDPQDAAARAARIHAAS